MTPEVHSVNELRIELLDAWVEWDDACRRVSAAAVSKKKGKPTALAIDKETRRFNAAVAAYVESLALPKLPFEELLMACRRQKLDYDECVIVAEAGLVALNRRRANSRSASRRSARQ